MDFGLIFPAQFYVTFKHLFQNALEAEDYVCVLSFKSSCTLEGVVQPSQTLCLICVMQDETKLPREKKGLRDDNANL